MALQQGSIPSTKGIQVNQEITRDEGIATAGILPGSFVVGSGTAGSITAAGAVGNLTGDILGHAMENLYPGKDYRTTFATGDAVPYNKNHDSAFMGIIAGSPATALAYGDALMLAAGGKLTKYVAGTTDLVVAKFDEKTSFTPDGATDTYHRVTRAGL